jgi:hypothetical protein
VETWPPREENVNPPITSVVMSVYNDHAFLAEAVECILSQTFAISNS